MSTIEKTTTTIIVRYINYTSSCNHGVILNFISISVLNRLSDLESPAKASRIILLDSSNANRRSKDLVVNESQVEEKRYDCHLCGKTYKHSGTLTRHLKNHSGYKPFVCSVCNKAFYRQDTCREHVLQVHCYNKKNKETSIF